MIVCIDFDTVFDGIFTLVVSGFVSICLCGIFCFSIEDEFGLVEIMIGLFIILLRLDIFQMSNGEGNHVISEAMMTIYSSKMSIPSLISTSNLSFI